MQGQGWKLEELGESDDCSGVVQAMCQSFEHDEEELSGVQQDVLKFLEQTIARNYLSVSDIRAEREANM